MPLIMLDDCKLDTDIFWLIDDILQRCSMAMFFGPGGGGKTYFATSIAFGIASGKWFSYDAEPGAVLVCAFERAQDAEIGSPRSATFMVTRNCRSR